MAEETLQELQETLAHQERQISDLSDMVITQGHEIEALKKHIQKLESKVEDLEDGETGDDANVKPPHY